MGPGTQSEKRLKRGDPGINRLDRIAKQHDIDYSKAKNLQDKWKADAKVIESMTKRCLLKKNELCVYIKSLFSSLKVIVTVKKGLNAIRHEILSMDILSHTHEAPTKRSLNLVLM